MTDVNDAGDPLQGTTELKENVIVSVLGEHWSCWQPLITTTSIYCLMIFFVGIAISLQGPAVTAFFIGISISFSMVQLTGIFAVLGPGGYLTRLAVSQFCGGMFLLSLIGGVAVSGYEHPGGFFGSLWIVAVVGSASAQMIYGVFRLSRGWQIHLDIHERGPAYTMKDLFALTLFIAVLLSAVNLNASTTAPEESRIRLILSVFVFVSVGTLVFGVPTVATSLRISEGENGCSIHLMILVAILFIVLLPVLSIGAPLDIAMPVLFAVCGISLFTWLPLAFLRGKGVVLSRNRDAA